jgi:hypothetical protein
MDGNRRDLLSENEVGDVNWNGPCPWVDGRDVGLNETEVRPGDRGDDDSFSGG